MDGKILGFDAAAGTGAIKAGDGSRYTFAVADWRGANPPKPGDDVDFEADGSVAKEIYPTKTGLNIDLSALGGAASGAASSSGAAQVFLASWGPILAVASFIFCLLPFASLGLESGNLFGIMDDANKVKQGAEMLGSMGNDDLGMLGMLMSLYPALFLIPAAAIWVLAFAFMNRPLRLPNLVHGGLCLGLPIVLVLFASAAIPETYKSMGGDIELGIGGWLLVIVGIVQLLATLGVIKGSPAGLLNKK